MENTTEKPKAITKKTKVELSYRQWMRIVNYYSNSVCGITVSFISDWNWRDEFYEENTTLENHINSACGAFETFLMDVEPSHYKTNMIIMIDLLNSLVIMKKIQY